MFCETTDRDKMRIASHTLEDPAGGVVRGLIDDLDELEAALSAARADVEWYKESLSTVQRVAAGTVEEYRAEVERLQNAIGLPGFGTFEQRVVELRAMEAAAKAWHDHYGSTLMIQTITASILSGIGPDGKPVKP